MGPIHSLQPRHLGLLGGLIGGADLLLQRSRSDGMANEVGGVSTQIQLRWSCRKGTRTAVGSAVGPVRSPTRGDISVDPMPS